MSPAEIMSALGISQYKTNPQRPFDMALVEKYGLMAAADIEEFHIGPHCDDKSCIVPYGIGVGIAKHIPVKATVSFDDGQITEVVVSFNKMYWDEMLPIWNEKYGADLSTPEQKCIGCRSKNTSAMLARRPRTGVFSSGFRLGSDYPPAYPGWHGVSGVCSD